MSVVVTVVKIVSQFSLPSTMSPGIQTKVKLSFGFSGSGGAGGGGGGHRNGRDGCDDGESHVKFDVKVLIISYAEEI